MLLEVPLHGLGPRAFRAQGGLEGSMLVEYTYGGIVHASGNLETQHRISTPTRLLREILRDATASVRHPK